jgi:hypothetical protein
MPISPKIVCHGPSGMGKMAHAAAGESGPGRSSRTRTWQAVCSMSDMLPSTVRADLAAD